MAYRTPATMYLQLMNEIKDRLAAVKRSGDAKIAEPVFGFEYLAAEFALHQLRIVCEMVALACLAAHDNVSGSRSKDLRKAWSASDIFFQLGKLNADFYPVPIAFHTNDEGIPQFTPVEEGFLTREELKSLYEHCNSLMHRAKFEEIWIGKPKEYNFKYLQESAGKLQALLDVHLIRVAYPDRQYLVRLNGPSGVRWDALRRVRPA